MLDYLANFRIPSWIWGLAIIINAILMVYNFEQGNDEYLSFNILCTIACILGAVQHRQR
tara:strand:+ start:271 stop:447 length:177 start_codon:yes stop_codon:yes gene_type:complete